MDKYLCKLCLLLPLLYSIRIIAKGGKTTDSTGDRAWGAIGKFAVRFNRILTVVGIYNSVSNSGNSTNNFDDDNTYTNNEVKFKFYRHAYIAVGL